MTKFAATCLLMGLMSAGAANAEPSSAGSAPAEGPTYTLTLSVEGVRASEGQIMAQLLKADYATGVAASLQGVQAPARVGATILTFTGLAAGDYAIQIFHDEDSDGELKTNVFGLPKEGFAFSNRAKAKFGPPDFKDMKVTVSADTATSAVMAY